MDLINFEGLRMNHETINQLYFAHQFISRAQFNFPLLAHQQESNIYTNYIYVPTENKQGKKEINVTFT